MTKLTLTNARMIDGTGALPRENVSLLIEDGRIKAVQDGSSMSGNGETLDLRGRTVMPGLINAHIHIMFDAGPDSGTVLMREGVARSVLKAAATGRKMLEAGITTARDLGGFEYAEMALRDEFASGEMPGPRLLCAGKLITMTGGHGWPIGIEADGPEEVRKAARENLKRGADCLKLMATGGVLTPGVDPGSSQLGEEELRAGIEEARKVGKRTASHAQGTEGVKNAIRAGIDTIEHGIFLDDEAIEMMAARGVVFIPTLAAPYQIVRAGAARGVPPHAIEKSEKIMDAHRRSFEWALASGVTIGGGNDGGTPFNPCEDLVTEMRLMIEYGMNPMMAIQACTLGSAKALGLSEETGTLRPGLLADILILREGADPIEDITAAAGVDMVLKRGEIVVRDGRVVPKVVPK